MAQSRTARCIHGRRAFHAALKLQGVCIPEFIVHALPSLYSFADYEGLKWTPPSGTDSNRGPTD
jgi:hypothetical protein